jgi:hypothetical protein
MPRIRRTTFDAHGRLIGLKDVHLTEKLGTDRIKAAPRLRGAVNNFSTPEPAQELDDSELSDGERSAAIRRERARRAGLL